MANSYTQITIQYVFAVKSRENFLLPKYNDELKNTKKWYPHKFNWQTGYGAFSYSYSHRPAVFKYIKNLQIHHQKENFKTEYFNFLNKFEIEFKNEYVFEFYD